MDYEQQSLEGPSCRLSAHIKPYETGYEWHVTEYSYAGRKWKVIDSGEHPNFTAACFDLARSLEEAGSMAF